MAETWVFGKLNRNKMTMTLMADNAGRIDIYPSQHQAEEALKFLQKHVRGLGSYKVFKTN